MKFIKDKGYFLIGVIDIIASIFALKSITSGDLLILKPFAYFVLLGGAVLIIMSLVDNEKQKKE